MRLVKVEEVEEWEIERILNKRKVRGVIKYLVQWKGFIGENESWEKEEDLENAKELVVEFKRKMSTEVRK